MIGVVVNESDLDVVAEFFELFKTPWERAVPGRRYRVVLVTDESFGAFNAEVLLIYGSRGREIDREVGVCTRRVGGPANLEWKDVTFPAYKGVGVFESAHQAGIIKLQGKVVAYKSYLEERVVWRIGYDLFDEIRFLLTEGQPVEYALTPTLEFHIAVLRDLLTLCQISFVEIPPNPHGYDFICCLTHDVDFFGIRRHLFDHTMAGFLYRASLGTLIDLIRGRRSLKEVCRNWLAVLSLPLVFLRVLPDFWRPFEDYAEVEDRNRSTFFLVPFKGKAGIAPDGSLNKWRATPYGIKDVQKHLKAAIAGDSELALHGIDAWLDAGEGREELNQLVSLTGQKTAGVRMHWLYFDRESPGRLEKASFDYDSTCGFNETIGYRAGTTQVFRPLGCSTLMELPMAIMDSALFSSGRLSLAPREALEISRKIVEDARHSGGTVVVNWHDRSLAPERLLNRSYQDLLEMVGKGNRVWFAKCGEAVEWFRWRRSICFEEDPSSKTIHVSLSKPPRSVSRAALVRVHRSDGLDVGPRDMEFSGANSMEIRIQTSSTEVEHSRKM